ncbi:MAG: BON domain-containing protein [Pyrinomonadaceae bacterium]
MSRSNELWIATSIIIAAALATFLALFITSRPYDLATASLPAQQTVPFSSAYTPSPRPSPSTSATPQAKPSLSPTPATAVETSNVPPDDASIQSHIDAAFAQDAVLSKLDVSALVENGKVTIVGSVRSVEVKQRVEKAIRAIRGVTGVDNQLVVNQATP